MPLNSSLISGSQSLFGVKSELKFGRLTATTVLSQQKVRKKKLKSQAVHRSMILKFMPTTMRKRHFLGVFEYYDEFHENLPVVMSVFKFSALIWVTNRTNDFND